MQNREGQLRNINNIKLSMYVIEFLYYYRYEFIIKYTDSTAQENFCVLTFCS